MQFRRPHRPELTDRGMSACTELQRWGQQIVAFIEDVAKERAGGAPATVRTIALCGTAGLVAYSMLGAACHLSSPSVERLELLSCLLPPGIPVSLCRLLPKSRAGTPSMNVSHVQPSPCILVGRKYFVLNVPLPAADT